ncbi:hypothetical protein J2X71_001661 [Rhizobium sp. 1399]|nr:hypothetical protein [Rhizobium sp. 1399]
MIRAAKTGRERDFDDLKIFGLMCLKASVGPKRSCLRVGAPSSQFNKVTYFAMRAKHHYRKIRPMLINLLDEKRGVFLLEIPDVGQELSIRQRFRAALGHRWAN